jgi:hypothetical protein
MTTQETAARRVIELSIQNRHDAAEAEMERIVKWDEDLIRRIVREEIARATEHNNDRVRRIGKLAAVVGALAGLAFPAAAAVMGYVAFGIEPPVVITIIASLVLAALGAMAGRHAAK